MSLGNRGGRLVRRTLALAALAALALSATPGAAQASQELPHGGDKAPFTLPTGTPLPPAGYRILSAYKVVHGVQIYTCLATGVWDAASTPDAWLARYGRPGLIHHYAGPRWTSVRDGSTILAAVDTALGSKVPKDGTIPWLRLLVTAHENSAPGKELNEVAYVNRVNTSGGVVPTGACTPGSKQPVPYHADYVFWVAS